MACSICGGNALATDPLELNTQSGCSCDSNSSLDEPQQLPIDCCGVTSVNNKTGRVILRTGDVSESTNLYFTNGRARGALSNLLPIKYNPATGVFSHDVSGVTANTYGDAANYPIITVDQYGHVTNVQLQPIAGGTPLGPDLTAIEALTGIGYLIRTAPDTWALRSLAGTTGRIEVVNPAGTNAPTRFDLSITGVVPGSYGDATNAPVLSIDAFGRVTAASVVPITAGTSSDRITKVLVANDFVILPADTIARGIILLGTANDAITLGTTLGGSELLPTSALDAGGKYIDNNILYFTANTNIYISGNANPVTIILPI